jgi:hypothetical protein|tara:strand:+ start:4276 stop:5916 length:1641 start_codon:yes stop_codon:yes gene_type:complete
MRYLFIFICFPITLFAEQTGNLVINGDFENNNSNNWTTTGEVQVLGDCCGSNYDLEFGLQGSIEQDFNLTSDTITQSILNNGITLDSSVLIQNGECTGNGCWAGSGRGGADSFTIRLQIKDSDNNILSTTTQERYDVTGINGETFENSVTHNGSDANIGNIYISGTDTNGVAGGLGGANVDDVSVIMTYDPVVLSATQTSHITTTFQEIEEVLFKSVETVEFIPIEEFTFEVYEEPEIIVEMPKEMFIQEIKKEEINTGIISLSFEPVETITELPPIESFEEIPMESIIEVYEESKTLETISAEVEVVEEKPKATEIVAVAEEITETENSERVTERESVREEVGTGNSESAEEELVSEETNEPNESSGNSVEEQAEETEVSETETAQSESTNETRTGSEESSTSDNESEQRTSESDLAGETDSENTETPTNTIANISIEKIATKVAEVVKEVDKQLVVTNMIVAKAMQSKINIDTYSSINNNLFNNQPIIDGGSYDELREYVDNRNIYQQSQVIYNDEFSQYQEKVDEAKANTIRAVEHLRKIRGY